MWLTMPPSGPEEDRRGLPSPDVLIINDQSRHRGAIIAGWEPSVNAGSIQNRPVSLAKSHRNNFGLNEGTDKTEIKRCRELGPIKYQQHLPRHIYLTWFCPHQPVFKKLPGIFISFPLPHRIFFRWHPSCAARRMNNEPLQLSP